MLFKQPEEALGFWSAIAPWLAGGSTDSIIAQWLAAC